MNQLTDILTERLTKKGIETSLIPWLMRSLANAISNEPYMKLQKVNRKLHLLGWDDFELDDHTFQLILAILEGEDPIEEAYNSAPNIPLCPVDKE